ncbi:MAG: integrase core domain-containing protein [Rhodospirillaceae bacterium]|nr:integrase core domain-containing protein [Rhodospirillaceae bacterium]
MNAAFSILLMFVAQYFTPRHNAQIRLLKAQIRMLQARLPTKRVFLSPTDKAELLRLGACFDHDIADLMLIVKPTTYRRWLRQSRAGMPFKALGRPRLTEALREAAIRMARENVLWGYRRITGELKKLGFYAGATSVKRILHEAGIQPSPEKEKKKPPLLWLTFVHAHLETMLACDFFTKDVFTARGQMTAYVLIFIHLGSRKVFCSAPTYSPDSAWVTQQARNAVIWCADQEFQPRFLIRDADTKFSAPFNALWKSEGARVIQIPHRAPQANAFAESFIATLKRECLDFFVCFGVSHLNYILRIWIRYYDTERPHRGRSMGNNVLDANFRPVRDGPVRCRKQLGGIIRSYYREAA